MTRAAQTGQSIGFCSHTMAVAGANKKLAQFLTFLRNKKKAPNMTNLVTSGMSKFPTYTTIAECVWLRCSDFVPAQLEVPDEVQEQLSPIHKAHLVSVFGCSYLN